LSYFANPTLRLFAGAICISFSPVWVKLVDVSPTTSGFYRVAIGGAALALFLVATGRHLHLSKRAVLILAASAVLFALDLWFFHRSINYVGPGLATLLSNFQVFFMMLAGVLLLQQRPRLVQLVAVPLALFGLGLIVGVAHAHADLALEVKSEAFLSAAGDIMKISADLPIERAGEQQRAVFFGSEQ
jgi:drug/metabolite transporter (DMT)-like permease